LLGIYCFFEKYGTCDFVHFHCTPDSYFQLMHLTSRTTWGLSEHLHIFFLTV